MDKKLKIATLRGPSAVEMIRMEAEVLDEPAQMLDEMAAGNLDFAVLPASMEAVLQKKGIDYRIAAAMIWGGLYVCGTDSGIKGIRDLKGRSISVMAGGTPPENMLRKLISEAGMDPDRDVAFDCRFPSHKDLYEAAEKGATELCILSEPFVSQALEANPQMHILLDIASLWQDAEGTLPCITALFCKGSLDVSAPDTATSVIDELKDSCEWVKGHPKEAAELVAAKGIFHNKKAVEASIPRSGFAIVAGMTKKT